jgi:hypothetical protein
VQSTGADSPVRSSASLPGYDGLAACGTHVVVFAWEVGSGCGKGRGDTVVDLALHRVGVFLGAEGERPGEG